jgi:membrane protein DedA with SNARE-associated domain
MFSALEESIFAYVHTLPLEAFVFVASIIEEIIAPIPSPTVMVLAGSVAQFQERALLALIPLALFGALGKTLGALVVYGIAHKAETFLMRTFGNFFNVSHEDVAKLGSKLGKGYKDYFFLTFLRALPIMPSVVVSAGSGLLKVSLPLFIVSTFLGTIIRDGFYLYAGYVGLEIFTAIIEQSAHIETLIEVVVVLLVGGWILRRRYNAKRANSTTTV